MSLLNRAHSCTVQYSTVVDVYGAQESIPPGWESIPGLLKRFTNTGSGEKGEGADAQILDACEQVLIICRT